MKTIMKIAAAGAFLLLAACGKEESEPVAEPALSVSPAAENLSFGAAAKELYTFEVTTNQSDWKAVSDQAWCTVEMDAGANTFTVSALPNDATTASAPATIIVSAGKAAPVTFTATQAGVRYEVYVAGAIDEVGPCYWKDGELHMLDAADPANAEVFSMCIADEAVYFCGHDGSNACYWKDGDQHILPHPQGVGNAVCYSIAVSDGKVYAAGGALIGEMMIACYWDEGDARWLVTDRTRTSYAKSIAASDGSLYIAGRYESDDASALLYWENGSLASLDEPDGTLFSVGSSVCVADGKVYVAGYNMIEGLIYACYWEDGAFRVLEDPIVGNTYCDAITVHDGTVHIAGSIIDERVYMYAFYWNRAQGRKVLPLSKRFEDICAFRGIAVCDGKVYISGGYGNPNERFVPCYWLDGERIDLPKPDGKSALTSSIAVMKR